MIKLIQQSGALVVQDTLLLLKKLEVEKDSKDPLWNGM